MKKNLVIIGLLVAALILFLVFLRFSSFRCPVLQQKKIPTEKYNVLLKNAVALEGQGELVKARDILRNILMTYTSSSGVEDVQKRLEDVNMKIFCSAINIPGETTIREVSPGDSLAMIAEEFHTTVEFIKKQNGLSSNVIKPGMRLRIWTGRLSLFVDKSQNLLTLQSNGEFIKTFHVSTGKNNITPVGNFKITNKLVRPAWTHNGKVIPADSPENILGTRWMGFDIPGYGIHGTTQPESIGQQATAGCVRMLNQEVEELYDFLPPGTEVTVVD